MKLAVLVGSGRKIGLLTLPFLAIGLYLNLSYPSFFAVGGPHRALVAVSLILLVPGIVAWAWSVFLILTRIPRWLGLVIGAVVYVGSRLFSPEEEAILARVFGSRWSDYEKGVRIPWL